MSRLIGKVICTLFFVTFLGLSTYAQEIAKTPKQAPLPEKVSLPPVMEKDYRILILGYDNVLKDIKILNVQVEALAKTRKETEDKITEFLRLILEKGGIPKADYDKYSFDLSTGEATKKPVSTEGNVKKEN